MANILIFSAGGVGCVYGYILHQAGATITAVCRTNYDAVWERGILVRSKIFAENCHYRPRAVRTSAEAAQSGPFDYIIVANHTAIVLAQNGIGIEEDYTRLYPTNTIISGVVYLPVTQTEPSIVEMGPLERFEIGTYPASASAASKEQVNRLSALWKAGGATAPVSDDVQPVRWFKLAVNAAWNPLTALSLCDDANYLRSSDESEKMVRKIMREVSRVAKAAEYPDCITEDLISKDLERPKSRLHTSGKEPSMLVDVRSNRPIEVDAILGNTLKFAKRYGVNDTPYLDLLYVLAKARNFDLVRPESWTPISFAVTKANGKT